MLAPKVIHPHSLPLPEFAKSLCVLSGFIEKEMEALRSYLMCPRWHSSVVAEQDWGLAKEIGFLAAQGWPMDRQHWHCLEAC